MKKMHALCLFNYLELNKDIINIIKSEFIRLHVFILKKEDFASISYINGNTIISDSYSKMINILKLNKIIYISNQIYSDMQYKNRCAYRALRNYKRNNKVEIICHHEQYYFDNYCDNKLLNVEQFLNYVTITTTVLFTSLIGCILYKEWIK